MGRVVCTYRHGPYSKGVSVSMHFTRVDTYTSVMCVFCTYTKKIQFLFQQE